MNIKRMARTAVKGTCILFYRIMNRLLPLSNKRVVISSSLGKSYSGNPKAIYEEMVRSGIDGKYECIWFYEKKKFDIPVSIDTYKSAVAKAALEAGADLLNDIWGFRYDEKMAELAAEYDVPVCLMHNRDNLDYDDFMEDVKKDLQISLDIAEKYGVKKENIMLDPGVGFGKTYEQNLMVMNHLEEIVDMGYPVLLGTSRKSVIGLTLDLPVDEREEGTLATSVLGAIKGCQFVRVHDVEKNVRALKMTDAILHS